MSGLLLLLMAPGCQGPCQQICGRMASYAEECGHEVSSEEIETCRASLRGEASRADRPICRDHGSDRALREAWTCDDLEIYFSRLDPDDPRDDLRLDTAW